MLVALAASVALVQAAAPAPTAIRTDDARPTAANSDRAHRPLDHDRRPVTDYGGTAATFAAESVRLELGGGTAEIGLGALGRRSRLRVVNPTRPDARRGTVIYRRRGITEWYRRRSSGIEQGFRFNRRPPGAGALVLRLRAGGSLRPLLLPAAGGRGLVALGVAGHRPIATYGGLRVSDSDGRALAARLAVVGPHIEIRVEDARAHYPLTIDPLIQQGAKLTATGETGAGTFGRAVAISSDGTTAVIGAPGDDGGNGAAFVFTRSNGAWTQQGTRLAGTGTGVRASFGSSVALSSDGNTALVGGPNDSGGNCGAVWVFTRSGTTWTQQGSKLTASDPGVCPAFGSSVALAANGNTALIGGPGDDPDGFSPNRGAAWVFTRSGSTWTQQGSKLAGSNIVGEAAFGSAVALSSDGNTALIGGPYDVNPPGTGAAWVFTRSGASWTQQGSKLTGSDQGGYGYNSFGLSVALSSDGDTALIGAPTFDFYNGALGAAYVFTRSASTWTQQGPKLAGSDEANGGQFGDSVGLSADGNTALIGGSGIYAYFGNDGAGAAWEFRRSSSSWGQLGPKLTTGGAYGAANFGFAVGLAGDGNVSLVGGPHDAADVGAAWAFDRRPSVDSVTPALGPPAGGTTVTISGSDLSGATAVKFGSTAAASFTVGSDTTITATTPAKPVGPVDVTVTTPLGTSATSPADTFSYATIPGAPGVVMATAGDRQASVSFDPAPANGAPVTSYTVTATPGGQQASGATSPIVVSGLSDWTDYTFTVTATNAVGTGPASGPSPPRTTLAQTTTSIAPSPSTTVHYGTDLSFTATVTSVPPAAPAPSGSVQFHVTNAPDPAPLALGPGQTALFDPGYYLDVGDTVDADYTGDATHVGSSAPPLDVQVEPAVTSVSLTLSPNPVVVGQEVTAAVTVHNESTQVAPFGSVQFMLNGEAATDPLTLDDNGQVVVTATPDARGDFVVGALYHDDTGVPADFMDSSASATEHVVASVAAPVATVPLVTPTPVAPTLPTTQTPPACLVPRLKGLALAAAKLRLRRAHCALGKVTRRKARRKQRGKVLATKPASGAKRADGYKVRVVLGR